MKRNVSQKHELLKASTFLTGILVLFAVCVLWINRARLEELTDKASRQMPRLQDYSEQIAAVKELEKVESEVSSIHHKWRVGSGSHPEVEHALMELLKKTHPEIPTAKYDSEAASVAARRGHREELRLALISALGTTNPPQFADALMDTVTDSSTKVAVAGARKLAALGDHRAIAPLRHCCGSLNEVKMWVRVSYIWDRPRP